MAKIDVSKIAGYAEMTAEQKLAALEAYEVDYTGYVKKDLLDKANTEAAGYKKQLREKQTADEQAAAQAAEAMEALKNELDALRKAKQITDLSKRWMGAGYSEALASSTANAMVEGNLDQVFKDFAVHMADHDKALKAEYVKQTPAPPAGAGTEGGMTAEKFAKLNVLEKQKFAKENPETYASFYK